MSGQIGQRLTDLIRSFPVPRQRRGLLLTLSAVLLALSLGLLFLWRRAQPYNDGTWQRVQDTGVLRVGMDASYPPFSDTPNETPVGLDVDIINEIGRRLKVRVEISNMGFDGLYDSLQTGQVDALISALSIDPSQLGRVMYTRSYIDAGQVLVVPSATAAPGMAALDGHTVAVEYGSAGDENARLWQRRLHILNIAHFTTPDEALDATLRGKADAALIDAIAARLYLRKHHGTQASLTPITGDVYALAVRLTSFDLGGAITDALNSMEQDGTLETIIRRWL